MTGAEKLDRCYVVYALAPSGLRPRGANDAFNEFIADPSRGLVVWHDHFIGDQGGVAVFHVTAADELARLRDRAPLAGAAEVAADQEGGGEDADRADVDIRPLASPCSLNRLHPIARHR